MYSRAATDCCVRVGLYLYSLLADVNNIEVMSYVQYLVKYAFCNNFFCCFLYFKRNNVSKHAMKKRELVLYRPIVFYIQLLASLPKRKLQNFFSLNFFPKYIHKEFFCISIYFGIFCFEGA